jgi:tetratricopeptide (TPR) repeat protein
MKRVIALMVLLALAAGGGALAYQAVARDRSYRRQLERGDAALSDRKASDAIEAYSGAIVLRPDSMLAYLRRGEAYLQRPDLELAARDFGAAATLDPSATRPLENLGDVQYRRERFAQAAQSYESRLRLDERSAPVTYKLALARYRARNLDGALAAIAQTLKLNDQLADAYYLRGMCLRDQRHPAPAIAAFEHAISLAPASIPAREELADTYGAAGRRAEEIEQLQALAALDTDRPARQVALGLAHARAGHWDLAVLTLSSALERTPNEALLYHALGQVWLDRPRDKNDRVFVSKAREALERVAAQPTATSSMLLLYGRALLQDGDVDGAERTLHDAVLRFPVDPAAFLDYAGVAERQNHLDAARAALVSYDQLTADDQDAAARASHVGAISLRLNEVAAAVAWFRKAVDRSPNDARTFAALAEAELRAGNKAGADAAVARGLAKDPANAALQTLARRLHDQPT